MSLADWPLPLTKDQSHLRANSGGIARRAFESDPQAGPGSYIAVKFGFGSVLRYHQIHPPVAVVVAQRRAALFPIDFDSRLLCWDGSEPSGAVAAQPQPAPRVQS